MRRLGVLTLLILVLLGCEKVNIDDLQDPLFASNISTGELSEVLNIGGTRNDVISSVLATTDGGYITAGYTQSNDGDITNKTDNSFDFWVMKFDENHNLTWQHTYGGSDDDRAQKIIQTADQNYLVVGYSDSHDGDVQENNGFRDFWILKLNSQGNLIWQKSYGFAGNDEGVDAQEAGDGSLYIAGLIDVSASGGDGEFGRFPSKHAGGDYWLLKLSNTGDLIWSRYFGGSFTDAPTGLAVNSQNQVLLVGTSDSVDIDISNNKGTYDVWTVLVGSDGVLLWEKSYGGSEIDQGKAVLESATGYYLTGDTRSSDQDITGSKGGADIWFANITNNGEIVQSFNLGGSSFDVPNSLLSTMDGNLILTGSSRSSDGDVSDNKGQNDVWVSKISATGSILWEVAIGGDHIDLGNQAAQLKDGSIVVVGESSSNNGDLKENKGFSDGLIIKIK